MFTINENCLNRNNCDKLYEPNFYNYKGLYKLNNFDNNLKSTDIVDNFYICSYRINNEHLYPFLDFLFKNDLNTNMISFPCLKLDGKTFLSIIQQVSKIQILLQTIFSSIELDEKYEYKGFYYYNNNIYLFFDFTNCKLKINTVYKKSNIWPVLVDEIINKKMYVILKLIQI